MADAYRIKLPAVDPSTAAPRVKEPLEGARKRMGMIPNMYTRMAHSAGVLETYLYGYERFWADKDLAAGPNHVNFNLAAGGEAIGLTAPVDRIIDAITFGAQAVLAVAVKTISNYVNHLFETPVDDAFKARAWSAPACSVA